MEKVQPDLLLEIIRDKRFTIGSRLFRYTHPKEVLQLVNEGGWTSSDDPYDVQTYSMADVSGLSYRYWDPEQPLPDELMSYFNGKYGKNNWKAFDLDRIAPTTPAETEKTVRDISQQAELIPEEVNTLRDVNALFPLNETFGVHIFVKSDVWLSR